jgi:hypothetical protein
MTLPQFSSISVSTADVFSHDLDLGDELGKGANNRVYEVEWNGMPCVLRVPRRRSDTQRKASAKWEYYHTLRASQLGCAPTLHKAWYVRHSLGAWPSGLYLLLERYESDLETVLGRGKLSAGAQVGKMVVEKLKTLSENDFFMYDFKPSNLVVRMADDADVGSHTPDIKGPQEEGGHEGGGESEGESEGEGEGESEEESADDDDDNELYTKYEVGIIDFGRDFCELALRGEVDCHTTHIDMAEKLLLPFHPDVDERTCARRHVLFVTMLVQLAAVTTRQLHSDRYMHRMCEAKRRTCNPFCEHAALALDSMQARHRAILRELLRYDEVRGVLQHYNGRRRAGTRRTIRHARGEEH